VAERRRRELAGDTAGQGTKASLDTVNRKRLILGRWRNGTHIPHRTPSAAVEASSAQKQGTAQIRTGHGRRSCRETLGRNGKAVGAEDHNGRNRRCL